MAKILVVDDNEINLKLACEILEREDFEVQKAGNADEAVSALKSSSPDIILLDIGMPGIDGFMFTRMLREDEKTKDMLVVALTASAMKGNDIKAYKSGFDGYLIKPIDTRNFGAQVREFLNKKNKPK